MWFGMYAESGGWFSARCMVVGLRVRFLGADSQRKVDDTHFTYIRTWLG